MNPWRGLSGLPREVWTLGLATLINRAGTMALPFMVLYLTQRLGFSAGQAGLVLTAYGIGALVGSPFTGRLSDHLGALLTVKFSLLLSGSVLVLLPLVQGRSVILGATVLWAVLAEAVRPASLALLTDLVPPVRRKAAFALNRLAVNLGMSVGPALGGLVATVSYPALFVVDGLTSIAAGIFLFLSPWRSALGRPGEAPRREPYDTESETIIGQPPELPALPTRSLQRLSALSDRRLLYFMAAVTPALMVAFQFMSGFPLFLVQNLRLPPSTYGMLVPINTLLIIFVEVPLNLATQHWPHRRALVLGALLYGTGFGGLAFATGLFSAAACIVIWTFGEMILFPASSAYAADCAPPGQRGAYMGLYLMTFNVAFTIGPWLGTEVLQIMEPARFGQPVLGLGACPPL